MKCTKALVAIAIVVIVGVVLTLPFLVGELSGWSNYGQAIGGMFGVLAFVATLFIIRIQLQQSADASKNNRDVLTKLDDQLRNLSSQAESLQKTARINALAAILESGHKLVHTSFGTFSKEETLKHASGAFKQLIAILNEFDESASQMQSQG